MKLTHTLALCAASLVLVSTTTALAGADATPLASPAKEAVALKPVFVNVRPAHPSVIADLERLVPLLEIGARSGVSLRETERLVWSGPF
jgi:hypothetical protein